MYHSMTKLGVAVLVALVTSGLQAAAPADEAAKLKTELTPLGAERAGNKDGTIPAWTGGLAPTGPLTGKRPDPFANDKPLFAITAKNMAQYADRLSEGNKALLKKYPDTYRMDVYKTHRTASAPQWVYDNTLRNATQATLAVQGGVPVPKGTFGGVPFPIPKSGNEAMWNHLLRWHGESVRFEWKGYQLTTDGRWIMVVDSTSDASFPYYFKERNAASFGGEYWLVRSLNVGPPIRAGEGILGRLDVDETKSQAWVYLTGQRRVRKLPNACCDTPAPFSAGVSTFDELEVFVGRQDRFDWKIVGKQEMFIPYNTNKVANAKSDAEVLGTGRHLSPDFVRWELHRVWVVEATLRDGQRHSSPRSRYYLDEDTWSAVLSDRWDANGQLARTGFTLPMAMPDVPATYGLANGVYDLISGAAYIAGMQSDQKLPFRTVPRQGDAVFSPESLAAEGVR